MDAKIPTILSCNNKIYSLGIGTAWFGRPWKPEDGCPTQTEVDSYLTKVFRIMEEGKVMIDTSPSYGNSEEKIGRFLRANSELSKRAFVATKWGEEFDSGVVTVDHSIKHLLQSVNRSIYTLSKIDLLYIHRPTIEALQREDIRKKMRNLGVIPYVGVSISEEEILLEALQKGLLDWIDVLQVKADVFLHNHSLLKGRTVVTNSPYRKRSIKSPQEMFYELSNKEVKPIVLTGTRHHLGETIKYAREKKLLICAYNDWSFWNIKPSIEGFKYDRWKFNPPEPNFSHYDLVIICEPHIEEWKKVYPSVKDAGCKVLSIQQGMYWNSVKAPAAAFKFDKVCVWGELCREAFVRNGLNKDRIIVTGNPRFDEFFDIETQDNGYILILGGVGTRDNFNRFKFLITGLLPKYHIIYKAHPSDPRLPSKDEISKKTTLIDKIQLISCGNTVDLIRKAKLCVFCRSGTGIMSMIMNKPSVALTCERGNYWKSFSYTTDELALEKIDRETENPTDNREFVRYAVMGKGAAERVRDAIISYTYRT